MVDGETLRKENGYNHTNGAAKRDIKANQIHQERIKTGKGGPKDTKNETKVHTTTKKTQKTTTQSKRLTKRSGQGKKTTKSTTTTQATKVGKPSSSTPLGPEAVKEDEKRKNVVVEVNDDRKGKKEGKRENEEEKKDEEIIGVKGTMEELLVSSFECLSTSDSRVEVDKTEAGVTVRRHTFTSETQMSMEYSYSKNMVAYDDAETLTQLEQAKQEKINGRMTPEANMGQSEILMIEDVKSKEEEKNREDALKVNTDLGSNDPEKDVQTNADTPEQVTKDEGVETSCDSFQKTNDGKEEVPTLPAGEKLSSVPLRMRQRMSKKDRKARCLSVGTPFPLSKSSKSKWRVSMFELSTDGWIVDRIRDGQKTPSTKTLNLDQDINDILESNTAAVVSLGNIKLRF